MTSFGQVLAYGLAVYLITIYLTETDGPKGIFRRLRRAAGINVPGIFVNDEWVPLSTFDPEELQGMFPMGALEHDDVYYESNGAFLADLLDCTRCTSFWVALLLLPFFLFLPLVVWLMAAAGISAFMAELDRD